MNFEKRFAIGLMSGTSLDGVDLIYVSFDKKEKYSFEIIHTKTYSYSDFWKVKLKDAFNQSEKEIKQLDIDYGVYLGELINSFIADYQTDEVEFVASHGHTIFHKPEEGITLQIGNGEVISNITNQKIICDFRTQDVSFGGQGAPLVPIGDKLLFSDYDYCLNLGGFANISFEKNNERIAYDICPVNIVLNKYAQELGLEYDDRGEIASRGTFLMQLETDLRLINYYKQKPPKSLGLEWVQQEIFPRLESSKRNPKDLLRTFTDHCAWAIARVIPKDAKVLVTGGGAYNDYLISKMRMNKKAEFIIPDKSLIEFKESLIFGFLGLLRVDNQINCLKSVTGAKKDHSSGQIYMP
jgi:anhydro-N-acetylmuramic acid kinase